MNGLGITATLEGEKQVSRRLLIVSEGIKDYSSPLRSIGGELQKTFQTNFTQRGGLFGAWAKRTKEYDWPLLEKTGEMRFNFMESVGPQELVIWNPTPHFKFHQSNRPRARLPRRIMMTIDNERRNFIIKQFQAYVVGLLRGRA